MKFICTTLLGLLTLTIRASHSRSRSREISIHSGRSRSVFSSDSSDTTSSETLSSILSADTTCSPSFFSPPDHLFYGAEYENRITVEDIDLFQAAANELDLIIERIGEAKENYQSAKNIYDFLYQNNPARPSCEHGRCEPILEIVQEEEALIEDMRRVQLQALREYKALIEELRKKRFDLIEELKLLVIGRKEMFEEYFEGMAEILLSRIDSARRHQRYSRCSRLQAIYDKTERNLALLRNRIRF